MNSGDVTPHADPTMLSVGGLVVVCPHVAPRPPWSSCAAGATASATNPSTCSCRCEWSATSSNPSNPSNRLGGDEPRLFQHVDRLLHAREGHVEPLGERRNRRVRPPEVLEHPASRGVGECAERGAAVVCVP